MSSARCPQARTAAPLVGASRAQWCGAREDASNQRAHGLRWNPHQRGGAVGMQKRMSHLQPALHLMISPRIVSSDPKHYLALPRCAVHAALCHMPPAALTGARATRSQDGALDFVAADGALRHGAAPRRAASFFDHFWAAADLGCPSGKNVVPLRGQAVRAVSGSVRV